MRGLLPLRATGFLQRGIAVYSPDLLNLPVPLCRRLLPFSMLRAFVRRLFACDKLAGTLDICFSLEDLDCLVLLLFLDVALLLFVTVASGGASVDGRHGLLLSSA